MEVIDSELATGDDPRENRFTLVASDADPLGHLTQESHHGQRRRANLVRREVDYIANELMT